MKHYRILTSAAAIMLASTGISFAQANNGGDGRASDLTCAEITAMDTATVPGILYFISGYSQGQRDSGAGNGNSTVTDSQSTGGASDSESSDGSSNSTTDTSTSQSGADDNSNSSNVENSSGNTSTSGSASSTSGATPEFGRIAGYFEIPVEQVMVACENEPDRSISEILDEEGQRQGDNNGSTSSSTSSSSESNTSTNTSSDTTGSDSDSGGAEDDTTDSSDSQVTSNQ